MTPLDTTPEPLDLRACLRLVAASDDDATALLELLATIAGATGAREARLLALDEGYARVVTSSGEPGEDWPFGETPAFQAVALGAPVFTPAEPGSPYGALRALGHGALLHLPLLASGACLGVLELVGADASWHPPDDVLAYADVLTVLLTRERQREDTLRMEVAWRNEVRTRAEDRRQIEDQLLHAARLTSLGETTLRTLPELAQAVHVIQSTIELLQREADSSPLTERSLPVVARAIERIAGLLRELRDQARDDRPPSG